MRKYSKMPTPERLMEPMRPNICGVVTEGRKSRYARKCLMVKGHKGLHFDVVPMRESKEKFYGSAKAYAKAESKRR